MRKASEIKELPVLFIQEGAGGEKVNRLAVNPAAKKVEYLSFEGTPWYEAPWTMPWSRLRSVGKDMITIMSRKELQQVNEEIRRQLGRLVEVVGSEVIDSSGRIGGKVADYVVDEASGELRKLILEDGNVLDIGVVVTIGAGTVITEAGGEAQAPAFSENEFLLGKTVAVDIADESGNVIIAAGTAITEKEIEAAKAGNALYDLVTGVK